MNRHLSSPARAGRFRAVWATFPWCAQRLAEFEPGDGIHRISPSSLLMIVADQDISA